MGIFPGLRAKPIDMSRLDPEDEPGKLSFADKLMAAAAALQGDPSAAIQLKLLAAQRGQAKRQRGLESDFASAMAGEPGRIQQAPEAAPEPAPDAPAGDATGNAAADILKRLTGGADVPMIGAPKVDTNIPQYNVTRGKPGLQTVRQALPMLLKMEAAGIPIKDKIEALKASQPDIQYVNNVRYDRNDPASAPKEVTALDKGQEHVYNARGEIIGVRNADGSLQAAADMAGAVQGAQERAKAAYDLTDVPLKNGSTMKMPRLAAVRRLSGQGDGATGADDTGFGVTQTPGEREAQIGNAKTDVERAAAQPQQYSGLTDQARTTDLVIDTIDRVLGEQADPKTGKRAKVGDGMIGGWTAGLGANLAGIKGTPAHDLQATLDTIRGNVGFNELSKMRANSPTGGALGQVSEQENRLLQSVLGSLDAGQSPDQLANSLRQVRDQLATIRAQRQRLYQDTYSGQGGGAEQPSRSEIEAELRKRGLLR